MTREIIFRGAVKGINAPKKRWVYGSLVEDNVSKRAWIIDTAIEFGATFEDLAIEVEPETVGQYTSLKSLGFERVFEDDIISIKEHMKPTNEIAIKLVTWDKNNSAFKPGNTLPFMVWEVIGNIHENPELLEKVHG